MAETQQEAQKPDGELPSSNSWSDADYISALQRLQGLQAQIDSLRAALPSLIAPLTITPAPSPISTVPPSGVYADFAAQAIKATRDVKSLREQWESQETKQILEHSQQSLDKDTDVDWEFVKSARWGDVPELEPAAQDVEMDIQPQPDQDSDLKKEPA